MSQYKVGDVAALFSKPKEPTTESGKHLQSLFKEFRYKNKKDKGSSQITQKGVNNLNQVSEKAQNQRVSKSKKRKFSSITNDESDEVSNVNKFKKVKKHDANSTEVKEKHSSKEGKKKHSSKEGKKKQISSEQDFPRRKKSSKTNKTNLENKGFKSFEEVEGKHISAEVKGKHISIEVKKKDICTEFERKHISTEVKKKQISSEQEFPRRKKSSKTNLKNNGFKSFEEEETALSNDKKEASDANFKSENKKDIDKKDISKFIKKLKREGQVAMNSIKNSGNGIMSNEDQYVTDTLFKEELEEFVKKGAKKEKKKKHSNDNFAPNRNLSHTSGSDNFESKTSQPKIPERAEPDFIKLPDSEPEDEEDKLKRTLFVGNLPVNTNKKALRILFSSFGEIEDIRYHGIETDKAKIFNENGSQTLNANNYAAESVPGFIVFCDRESAVKALSLGGSLFKGRHITVDFALPAGTKKMYDSKRSIFLGNLPFNCQDESVWEAFTECGRIENVRIVRDKTNGIGKGFGYVQFSTVLAKENALALKELDIQGRTIRIKAVDSNQPNSKRAKNPTPFKGDSFRSRAISIKKKNKDSTSRKSVKKIMKKQKNLHKKKKVANILKKAMNM